MKHHYLFGTLLFCILSSIVQAQNAIEEEVALRVDQLSHQSKLLEGLSLKNPDSALSELIVNTYNLLMERLCQPSDYLVRCVVGLQNESPELSATDVYHALPEIITCAVQSHDRYERPVEEGASTDVIGNGGDLNTGANFVVGGSFVSKNFSNYSGVVNTVAIRAATISAGNVSA